MVLVTQRERAWRYRCCDDRVRAGTGDTLTVTTANLDATGDTLSGIEVIDLSGTAGLDLTIDAADLANNAIMTVTAGAGGALELLKVNGTAGVDSTDVSGITTTTNSAVEVTSELVLTRLPLVLLPVRSGL